MLLVLNLQARFYHAQSNGERLQQTGPQCCALITWRTKSILATRMCTYIGRGRRLERRMSDTKNYLHTRRHLECETHQHHATLCLAPSRLVSSCCKYQQILTLEMYSSFLLAISNSRDQSLGLFYAPVMRKDRK
jgi:hypothetical protein